MKASSVALALATAAALACGGGSQSGSQDSLTGDWSIAIGDTCTAGTMAVAGASDAVTGNWECKALHLSGGVSGSLKSHDVTLTLHASGYNPILVNGTLSGDSISGTANGSGFKNDPFTAVRN